VSRDLDPALGAAEGDIDDRALVGHERGQRLDLVLVHHRRIADAALGRQLVLAVLRAPGLHHLDRSVVPFERESEVDDAVDRLDLLQDAARVVGQRCGAIEVGVYLLEEADGVRH